MNHCIKYAKSCELIIDQLVRFLVVEPTHPGLSHRLGTGARIRVFIGVTVRACCVHLRYTL